MTDLITAVQREIRALPPDLRQSGLAASALTLAARLDEAGPRDTAAIARELRTTLTELHDRANSTPDEESEIEAILRESSAELSKRT